MAPESLLQEWLGERYVALATETIGVPLMVPYDQLADVDGWTVTGGEGAAPDGAAHLPGALSNGANPAGARVASGLLVAADYAIRRGATDRESARKILERESPIALVATNQSESLAPMLAAAEQAGVPVLFGPVAVADDIAKSIAPFGRRRAAHAARIGRRHDPALSFQTIPVEESIGGNSLSSFVLHNEGERDGVTVTGEFGPRIAIEIGLGGGKVTIEESAELEALAASIPSFLQGVSSGIDGHSLKIGWRRGDAPSAEQIGEVLRTWLKAFTEAPIVDVRIAFAPPKGRSALLTDMRARAAAFRQYRAAVIAGDPDPLAAVSGHSQSDEE